MPRSIACISGKGGVGKTTTVASLAGALAQAGEKTLCIDMDPQSNLTSGLKVDPYRLERSIGTLLTEPDLEPKDIIVSTEWDNLDLLPATPDLAAVEADLPSSLHKEVALRDALRRGVGLDDYDVMLVDTPPNFGFHTINAMATVEFIVVPVQMSGFAIKGLMELLRTVHAARQQLNPDLSILGLLATFVNIRTTFSREILAGLREIPNLRVFDTTIAVTVKLQETALAGVPITYYSPSSPAAASYAHLAQEIRELLGRGEATSAEESAAE